MPRGLTIEVALLAAFLTASIDLQPVTPFRDTRHQVLVRIAADGAVHIWTGATTDTQRPQRIPALRFGAPEEGVSRETYDRLLVLLPALLTERSGSWQKPCLRIEVHPRAQHATVLWTHMAARDVGLQGHDLELSTRGRDETITLRRLPGLVYVPPAAGALLVPRMLSPLDGLFLHVSLNDAVYPQHLFCGVVRGYPQGPDEDESEWAVWEGTAWDGQLHLPRIGEGASFDRTRLFSKLAYLRQDEPDHERYLVIVGPVWGPGGLRARSALDLVRAVQTHGGYDVWLRLIPPPPGVDAEQLR